MGQLKLIYDKLQDRKFMTMVNSILTCLIIVAVFCLAGVLRKRMAEVSVEVRKIEPIVIHDTIHVIKPEPKRCFNCKSPLTFNANIASCCGRKYTVSDGILYQLKLETAALPDKLEE